MSDAPFLNNMQLQSEHKLILSPTVANSRMNRARKASGVNSYEQDIFFKPEEYLQNIIAKDKSASWLDLCCGEGNALLQVYEYFSNTDQLDKIKLTGIDLIECDKFLPDQIKIYIGPVLDFNSSEKFDLITCIHGLHYVGDKLEAISKASTLLTTDGLFIANLDFNDFAIENTNTTAFLNAQFKKNNLIYNQKRRLVEKHGRDNLNFDCSYVGADDNHGANYTGQESVKSYYLKK